MTTQQIKAVLFDLDGTLLDTETLSDKSIVKAFGDSLPAAIRDQHRDRLPWEIKKQLLGKRGDEWTPIVLEYAQEKWGVRREGDSSSKLPLPPSPYVVQVALPTLHPH